MTTKRKRMSSRRKKEWEIKCRDYALFLKDDFDFDWTYILLLLRYKLQRTRRSIEDGNHNDRKATAKEIAEVESLLWKVTEHDYEEEFLKVFHKKYGNPKMVLKECVPPIKHIKQMLFIYRNGKEATSAMNRKYMSLFREASSAKKEDLKKAFAIMSEKIWGWWA